MRVLLIDDEPAIIRGLKDIIAWEQYGYTVVASALNGAGALAILEERPIDLVIMDIRMPGMTGIELLKVIRERAYPVKVIISSAYDEFEYAKKCLLLGIENYLLKPIDQRELVQTLQIIRDKADLRKSPFGTMEEAQALVKAIDISGLENQTSHPIARKLIDHVNNHYHEEMSLKTLAHQFHISPKYAGQLFHQNVGMSFSEYLCDIRIRRAKELLTETTLRSFVIAKQVGFSNANYFSNVFKKQVGMYPSKYRELG